MNKDEMIIDFYDVDKMIKPLIEKLDHAFMVNNNDTEVIEFLDRLKSKKFVVDFNSTVENICAFVLKEIRKSELPGNVTSVTVRVYETNEDCAEEKISIDRDRNR